MEPRTRIRRRRSASRHGKNKVPHATGGGLALLTALLLGLILLTGPLVLGATPLWIDLPLVDAAALLFMLQGLRLTVTPREGAIRRLDAIDIGVVLFVLYAIARWLTSPTEYVSRIEVMGIVAYAGIFFTCRYGMANRRYCMWLLYVLVILGVGETIFGYLLNQHPGWYPLSLTETVARIPRWIGTYESPNHYASLLVMTVAAAVALGSFSKLPWPARIVLLYVAVMMIIGVIYSASRGSCLALLAAIVGLVVMGIRNGTMRWWVPLTGAAVLLVITGIIFVSSPSAAERVAGTPLAGDKIEGEPRVDLAVEALLMAKDHPYFGTGPATFIFVHPHYQEARFDFKAIMAHNDYLNCLDDYGLVGLGLAMFFVAAISLKFFRPLDVDHRWQDRVMVATGFAVWLALMVHSLFDFNLHIPANALIFFTLTGLAIGRIKQETKPHWSYIPLMPLGPWLGRVIILLAVAFCFLVTRTTLSDWPLEKASLHATQIPIGDCVSAAEQALHYEPGNADALIFLGDSHRNLIPLQKAAADQLAEGDKALDAYQKARAANPLDNSVEFRLGLTLDAMQKYPEAVGHYLAALAVEPHNGFFWYTLANHYLDSGQLNEADAALVQMGRCFHQTRWYYDFAKKRSVIEAANIQPPAASLQPAASTSPPAPPPIAPSSLSTPASTN